MTTTHLSRSALAAAAFVFALAGCSSVNLDEQPPAPIVDATAGHRDKDGPGSARVAPVDAQAGRGLDPLNDPNNPLSKRSVFFDFDSFVVKSEYQPIVQTHGSYLGTNKQRRVTVEGHTDERGGREYNLALGTETRRGSQAALDVAGCGRLAGRDGQLRRRKAAWNGVQRRGVGAESAGGFELSIAVEGRASDGRAPDA